MASSKGFLPAPRAFKEGEEGVVGGGVGGRRPFAASQSSSTNLRH